MSKMIVNQYADKNHFSLCVSKVFEKKNIRKAIDKNLVEQIPNCTESTLDKIECLKIHLALLSKFF